MHEATKVCLRISECSTFVSIFTTCIQALTHNEWKPISLSQEGVATHVYVVVMVQALREVLLDAIEGYLLVAEVMPTHSYSIHVRIYSNTVFVFFCILWCFN